MSVCLLLVTIPVQQVVIIIPKLRLTRLLVIKKDESPTVFMISPFLMKLFTCQSLFH